MTIELTPQTIITAGAVLAAIIAIGGAIFKIYDWCKQQTAQEGKLEDIRCHHDADVKLIKEEQTVIVYGLLACLKGLQEKGCNGPVTEAINMLEKHLNKEAHR